MLTLRGKAFQVKPLRPQIEKVIKFLNKTKLGQLFSAEEIAKAAGATVITIRGLHKGNAPELVSYSAVWRHKKIYGKPATLKLLRDEIKRTEV